MSDVTAGIFALVGALVGGAATFAGTVYEQHRSAKTTREDKIRADGIVAVERVMTEFTEVQKVIRSAHLRGEVSILMETVGSAGTDATTWRTKRLHRSREEKFNRYARLVDRYDRINIAMMRVSDERLQRRIRWNLAMLYTPPPKWSSETTSTRMLEICEDAFMCLGAFARGKSLPSPSPEVMEARLHWEEHSGVKGFALFEAFRFES
ncbi:hypothetical protein [Streptomyces sp. RTd22]|uniref:hypothetical protein n=1 Tax=Streptomyces sp. RTd22 TaxID=1841249 RepID=UPI00131CEE47|nr:hypothetical protein [Streptomyces sp. RTd22]